MEAYIRKLKNINVVVIESVHYSKQHMQSYVDIFNMYVEEGVIIKGDFNGSWRIKTGIKVVSFKFDFNEVLFEQQIRLNRFALITYNDFVLAVKSFILYKLSENVNRTLYAFLLGLKKLVEITEYFNISNINSIKSKSDIERNYISTDNITVEFLSEYFTDLGVDQEYTNLISDQFHVHISKDRNPRDLPSFETMFKFDEIMRVFYETCNEEERERYFPIILWWFISSIIPIRTTDFLVMPYDCTRKDGEEYFITLMRNDIKGGVSGRRDLKHNIEFVYRKQELKTTKNIYDLICQYKLLVDGYDFKQGFYGGNGKVRKREFLLSQRSYFKFMNYTGVTYTEMDILTYDKFMNIFYSFFTNILIEKYGVKVISKGEDSSSRNVIHRISPMDTRHFAMMSMAMLGYEPTTIMELAGQKSINSAYHYIGQLKEYSSSFILSAAKRMAYEKTNNDLSINLIYNDIGEHMIGGKLRYKRASLSEHIKTNDYRKINGGYCDYVKKDNVPCMLCKGNHYKCSHFIPTEEQALRKVEGAEVEIENLLSNEIKTLEWLVKNHTKIVEFTGKYQTSLSKIRAYMEHKSKSICDYQILGVDKTN